VILLLTIAIDLISGGTLLLAYLVDRVLASRNPIGRAISPALRLWTSPKASLARMELTPTASIANASSVNDSVPTPSIAPQTRDSEGSLPFPGRVGPNGMREISHLTL
jgi:hypothetical protein